MSASRGTQPIVSVQGLDKNYRYTGSYDEVRLGPMPLEYIERLIDYVASIKYPPDFAESDLCPVGIFVEAWGASLELYYEGDGVFDVRVIDRVSSTDMFIMKDVGPPKVKDVVRRFIASREGVEEILGPEPLREYYITVMDKKCDPLEPDVCWEEPGAREVSPHSIIGVPGHLVMRVELRRGGFMRKPSLTIVYIGERGYERITYKLPGEEELGKAYKILNILFPGKVSIS